MTNSIYRLFFIMMVFMMAPSTQANDIYITQVGDNLDLDIVQDGTDNEVGNSTTATVINGDNMAFDITQQGNYNTITATIKGADYTGTWEFTGSSNTVDLDCSSSASGNCDDVTLNITTEGDSNDFSFDIGETADGSESVVNFVLDGDNNIINSTINGTKATLTVTINNSASLATTSANSDEGVAITTVQTGNGVHGHGIEVDVTGGGGTIDINQSGLNDQKVDLTIQGDSFDVDITQSD
jgi:hypothetical protein